MSRKPDPAPVAVDRLDLRLLTVLQQEGRISKAALAERINLSPSPCFQRMRRLERAGVVRGYHADIDIDRLCRRMFVFALIALKKHEAADYQRFENAIRKLPECLLCLPIGGDLDYIVRFVTVDMEHYNRILESLLNSDLGISHYSSHFVTGPGYQQTGYPLEQLVRIP